MEMQRWCHFLTIKILVLLSTYGTVQSQITCSPGLKMPGYTIPQGDIIIEEGHDLDIMCVVTNNTDNNASLSFQRNSDPIPSENIEVINSTSIKLHYPNPPLSSGDTYMCLLKNETPVCMNRVAVGKKPQKVTDFACISNNFDNLTCTWTGPENYVRTDYSLLFTLGGGRSSRLVYPFECRDIKVVGPNMSCFWNVSTTPPYRQVHEIFNFTLTMNNTFGTNQINEVFNHFAHVLSGPPENLTYISTTPSSIYLYWVVPLSMQTFPPGVHHRILYQCEYGEKKWYNGGLLGRSDRIDRRKYATFNLTNIPYAHALCDIRVSIRSAKALPEDESMWSRNASINVRTSSKIPDEPPQTNIGSFEVTNLMDFMEVYIYWKQIPEVEKNGPEFAYKVEMEGYESVKPVELTHTYAKFSNLVNDQSYTFHIWSTNANGSSIEKSTVYVPRQSERVKEPVVFTKVDLSEGEYELAWEAPRLSPNQIITNYTIFSCNNERERPYQCTGMLNWTVVPSDRTAINITVDKNKLYQFAISTNTLDSSSGMLWAPCTVIRNKSVGKLKYIWVNRIGATFMELGWKQECLDNIGSVKNYIVYYCPIISPLSRQCKGPQLNMSFDGTATGGNVTNLHPYTTYMMSVAALTKHTTYSQQSDPLFNTTLETAPSVPQDLEAEHVTNSTILVTWHEPLAKNGILRFYQVRIRGRNLDETVEVEHRTNYMWKNLSSYERYTIWVSACTHDCSERAQITVTTKMGYPSKISKPTVDRRNDTTITIVWSKPSEPGGNIDHYIIRLKQKRRLNNVTLEYNRTDLKYILENCGDGDKFNTFYVSVKAVNKLEGREYPGEWSDELENYCDTPFNYIIYISIAAVLVILCSVGVASTKLYSHCKVMSNVEVKLPPGLAPVVADHTLVPWSIEKPREDHQHSPPDEELLLVKMSENRHFSGDSSGCSSGHESVTSSLESGTHISSSSDSGTEQPVDYLSLAVDPKLSSAYVQVAEIDDIGYHPSDGASGSESYVMSGEATKRNNPGYVPHEPPEPVPKSTNSGYVVAGFKNPNGYIPFGQTEPARNSPYLIAGLKNCKID